jgi:hypothetical protein
MATVRTSERKRRRSGSEKELGCLVLVLVWAVEFCEAGIPVGEADGMAGVDRDVAACCSKDVKLVGSMPVPIRGTRGAGSRKVLFGALQPPPVPLLMVPRVQRLNISISWMQPTTIGDEL